MVAEFKFARAAKGLGRTRVVNPSQKAPKIRALFSTANADSHTHSDSH